MYMRPHPVCGLGIRRGDQRVCTHHTHTEERCTEATERRQPPISKEMGLRRNQPCQHLDLRLLASRIVRKYIFVVEATNSLWYLMAALRN